MVNFDSRFDFQLVSEEKVRHQFNILNVNKATTFKNIPMKILKQNKEVCIPVLTNIINKDFSNSQFPDKLKIADVVPVFKNKDATVVNNYRPVSVLPAPSKISERLLQDQLTDFISDNLSPYLCGYRKGYNCQYALIALIEEWRGKMDNRGHAGAVLMDLSKAFDCMKHDLLLAKLYAYGLSIKACKMIQSYLSNRFQRVKINTSFSSWSKLLLGVPQGSVLGPLLFNIYINDLFWVNQFTNVCNFADDTTFYSTDLELKELIRKLEHDSSLAIEWFESNYMKLNTDKCHLLVSGDRHEYAFAKIGDDIVGESMENMLLGVTIDNKLSFVNHIKHICKKSNSKLTALFRYSKILNFEKRRVLLKSFIESQFSYSPLAWMFHDRWLENKINRIHERALRFVYDDDIATFKELLVMDGSFTIHQRNIQTMIIEMYKSKHEIGPDLLKNIFTINDNYEGPHLRSKSEFTRPNINTVHYGNDSLQYFGSVIWELVPQNIKEVDNLEQFKDNIKNWAPDPCPCRLCRVYIGGVGYCNITE